MDQLIATVNPFGFMATLVILGVVLLFVALAMSCIDQPGYVPSWKRQMRVLAQKWAPTVGLIGATTLLVGLVALWALVSLPPPRIG